MKREIERGYNDAMTLFVEFRRIEDMGGRSYLIMDLVRHGNNASLNTSSRCRVGSLLLGTKMDVPTTDGVYYVEPGLYCEIPVEEFLGHVRWAINMAMGQRESDCKMGSTIDPGNEIQKLDENFFLRPFGFDGKIDYKRLII